MLQLRSPPTPRGLLSCRPGVARAQAHRRQAHRRRRPCHRWAAWLRELAAIKYPCRCCPCQCPSCAASIKHPSLASPCWAMWWYWPAVIEHPKFYLSWTPPWIFLFAVAFWQYTSKWNCWNWFKFQLQCWMLYWIFKLLSTFQYCMVILQKITQYLYTKNGYFAIFQALKTFNGHYCSQYCEIFKTLFQVVAMWQSWVFVLHSIVAKIFLS